MSLNIHVSVTYVSLLLLTLLHVYFLKHDWSISMDLYIKEMNDNTALLLTDIGNVVATFSSVDDAVNECSEWLQSNELVSEQMECYFAD